MPATHGRRHVRVCTAAACFAATGGHPLDAVERELGVHAGAVSADGAVSLQSVRCPGHCCAALAALNLHAAVCRPGPDRPAGRTEASGEVRRSRAPGAGLRPVSRPGGGPVGRIELPIETGRRRMERQGVPL
ncbi:NAD(P)H-dependent oxidoreductase subunit E [Streptomyces sp. NPDC097981]|uniref:NAD(P)H-dependent oxidoreductase subunit E n=1 Tax=Streptomyces sp. NPDC097981 TaxID=3155428 RepID=UPI0033191758